MNEKVEKNKKPRYELHYKDALKATHIKVEPIQVVPVGKIGDGMKKGHYISTRTKPT